MRSKSILGITSALAALFVLSGTSRSQETFGAYVETDETGVYVCTKAPPGRLIQLESSSDLQTWQSEGAPIYSFGQEIRAWVRDAPSGDNSGGGGGSGDPPQLPDETVFFYLRSFTNTQGDAKNVFASQTAVSGTGTLVSGSEDFTQAPPLFSWSNENYQYLVAVTNSEWDSLYEETATEPASPALTAFLNDYQAIYDTVIMPYQTEGADPPGSTSSSVGLEGERVFFKWTDIDLGLDSNGDGISDTEAFSLGLNPFVSDGDTDGDGYSDVEELADLGADPTDSEEFPDPTLYVACRSVHYAFGCDQFGFTWFGDKIFVALGEPDFFQSEFEEDVTSSRSFLTLSDYAKSERDYPLDPESYREQLLQEFVYDAFTGPPLWVFPSDKLIHDYCFSEAHSSYTWNNFYNEVTCEGALIKDARFWIKTARGQSKVERKFLIVEDYAAGENGGYGDVEVIGYSQITVTGENAEWIPTDVESDLTLLNSGTDRQSETSIKRIHEVRIENRDRFVTGSIPDLSVFGAFEVEFREGSTTIGSYQIDPEGTDGIKIYDEEEIEGSEGNPFGELELDAASLPNEVTNQAVHLVRTLDYGYENIPDFDSFPAGLDFSTITDDIGEFSIVLKVDGEEVQTFTHTMDEDEEWALAIATLDGFISGNEIPNLEEEPVGLFLAAAEVPELSSTQRADLIAVAPAHWALLLPDPATAADEYEDDFAEWVRMVNLESTAQQWVQVAGLLDGFGYDTDRAVGAQHIGWTDRVPAGFIPLRAAVTARNFVSKILYKWFLRQVASPISLLAGFSYGLWDGVKADAQIFEDALNLPQAVIDTLSDPYAAAAEIYNAIEALSGLTTEGIKQIGAKLVLDFFDEKEELLDWPDPHTKRKALDAFVAGIVLGFTTEQVISFVYTGFLSGVKVGKWIKTLVEAAVEGTQILATAVPRVAKTAQIVARGLTQATEGYDDMRAAIRVAKLRKNGRIPDRKDRTEQINVSRSTADSRLDTALGGFVDDGLEAHHLVPWSIRDHPIVVKGVRAGFNFNGKDNGMLLDPRIHQRNPGHPGYIDGVEAMLDELDFEFPNMDDREAAANLLELADQYREYILRSKVGLGSIEFRQKPIWKTDDRLYV